MLAAVIPLPRTLVTPPVTKTYFDMGQGSSGVFLMLQKSRPGTRNRERRGRVAEPLVGGLTPWNMTCYKLGLGAGMSARNQAPARRLARRGLRMAEERHSKASSLAPRVSDVTRDVPSELHRGGSGTWRVPTSHRRRPRPRRRIHEALAPDFGATEPAARRWGARRYGHERRRIVPPRGKGRREPSVDLAERGPAVERPASLQADPFERALGEDHVAVAGRVAVALTVADVHDLPARGPMGEHALALAGAADEDTSDARSGTRSRRRRPENVVRAVTIGRSPTPSASSAGSMKKPKPSDTISTGMPASLARRAKPTKPGSCGWAAAVARSTAGSASISDTSQASRRREPIRPAS